MKDKVFVKYCGITNVKDAINAENSGCDAMGFVFVKKSKRFIALDDFFEIHRNLTPLMIKVALFSDNCEAEIEQVIKSGKIHIIQFHGHESPEFCEKFNFPYWKAIPMGDNVNPVEYAKQYKKADAFLIDNYGISKMGGSGETFDWQQLPKLEGKKWILAGGLNNQNVQESIEQTGIKNLDLSSGIEQSAGIKSNEKMVNFINKIKTFK